MKNVSLDDYLIDLLCFIFCEDVLLPGVMDLPAYSLAQMLTVSIVTKRRVDVKSVKLGVEVKIVN